MSPANHESRDLLRAQLALAPAGLTFFTLLHGTQPILPQLTQEFGVSPATASITAAAAGTAAMAFLLVPLSLFADRCGRERLMRWGLADD